MGVAAAACRCEERRKCSPCQGGDFSNTMTFPAFSLSRQEYPEAAAQLSARGSPRPRIKTANINESSMHEGMLALSDGSQYVGQVRGGEMAGRGTRTLACGSQCTGQWKGGKLHGSGTERWADGSVFEGKFRHGEKCGHGVFIWSNGCMYEGEFVESRMHGEGCYTWGDGRQYTGQWLRGVMGPSGRMVWPDGRNYEGEFQDGRKHGHGLQRWADGHYYRGQWANGRQDGIGIARTLKGIECRSRWKNGRFVEWINEGRLVPRRPRSELPGPGPSWDDEISANRTSRDGEPLAKASRRRPEGVSSSRGLHIDRSSAKMLLRALRHEDPTAPYPLGQAVGAATESEASVGTTPPVEVAATGGEIADTDSGADSDGCGKPPPELAPEETPCHELSRDLAEGHETQSHELSRELAEEQNAAVMLSRELSDVLSREDSSTLVKENTAEFYEEQPPPLKETAIASPEDMDHGNCGGVLREPEEEPHRATVEQQPQHQRQQPRDEQQQQPPDQLPHLLVCPTAIAHANSHGEGPQGSLGKTLAQFLWSCGRPCFLPPALPLPAPHVKRQSHVSSGS